VIFGVGTDVVELSRIQATYDRFGEHFVRRILMEEELALFRKTRWPVRFLAMRFAGKEATSSGQSVAGGCAIASVSAKAMSASPTMPVS
jgi:holo-[acyl-carrier protein] synthase